MHDVSSVNGVYSIEFWKAVKCIENIWQRADTCQAVYVCCYSNSTDSPLQTRTSIPVYLLSSSILWKAELLLKYIKGDHKTNIHFSPINKKNC